MAPGIQEPYLSMNLTKYSHHKRRNNKKLAAKKVPGFLKGAGINNQFWQLYVIIRRDALKKGALKKKKTDV